jgi:voltage-gated potassium channel
LDSDASFAAPDALTTAPSEMAYPPPVEPAGPPGQLPSGDVRLSIGWEFFIAGLTLLSIVNLILFPLVILNEEARIVAVMEIALSVLFVGDVARRLWVATDRRAYLVGGRGWLDLAACAPLLRVARLPRLLGEYRLVHAVGGPRPAVIAMFRQRAQGTLMVVALLAVLLLEFGAMGILALEARAPDGNIKTASDALWYLVVTMSTVGYGDKFPVTDLGRFMGAVLLLQGIALFATFTAYLADMFRAARGDEGTTPERSRTGSDMADPDLGRPEADDRAR